MSDDEHSDSSSDPDDILTEGLVAQRSKRATAGNLYATLRANLDDEELQKELLAEDEEDEGDYEGSDREDDDAAMESSGDEDDAGPPKDGEQEEDLEGEKELKKVERAEAKRKRKLEQAKMRIPAWQKKRVKLADDVRTDEAAPMRPKKKSERSNWLPTGADAPIRQSGRSSAITNREITHANLKQSAARSEKQRKLMKHAAEREKANKRADLTQEQRLAKVKRIERETALEFGRWEREEAERQRIREEQLAAKRRRGELTGPVIRHWSGSVIWEGDKIKIRRVHAPKVVEPAQGHSKAEGAQDGPGAEQVPEHTKEKPTSDVVMQDAPSVAATAQAPNTADTLPPSSEVTAVPQLTEASGLPPGQLDAKQIEQQQLEQLPRHSPEQTSEQPPEQPPAQPLEQPRASDNVISPVGEVTSSPSQAPLLLEGIEAYAAHSESVPQPVASFQTLSTPTSTNTTMDYLPSAPGINGPPLQAQPLPPQILPPIYHAWPLGPTQHPGEPTQVLASPPPPPPPPPLVREQAQRSLIMLQRFAKLDSTPGHSTSSRASKSAASKAAGTASNLEPTPLASTMFPMAYPTFTPDEGRYLSGKMKKLKSELNLPAAPGKPRCALTSWPARYRDPKTGLPYADQQTYKMIQRILSGGCAWSGVLGAWVGPWYGDSGRPARGVPDGFARRAEPAAVVVPVDDGPDGKAGVKMEDV